MKAIVFGATGMVGKQLVKQLLYKGHFVKAFGRNIFTEDLPENNDELELVQGALFDEKQVRKAIEGCDVVFSAIGGAVDGTDMTRSLGMKNIVTQMTKNRVKRIVGIGGFGVLNADEEKLLIELDSYPQEYVAVGMEHLKAFKHLESSSLDWTFVCPPNIVDAEATGIFHTKANYAPDPNNYFINAGDLAMFMIDESQENNYLKQRVGISG